MQAVYFLLLLVAGISAKPLYKPAPSSGTCGSMPYCQMPTNGKFSYMPGTSYYYQVKSGVKTSTSMPDSKEAGLMVKATARIGVIQNCELELELSNIELMDEKSSKIVDNKFTEDLKIPLRFEWTDGRIGEVCPTSETESKWSLNYKRSVLSALQNSMETIDSSEPVREIDATGDCWANYEVESSDSTRKIVKWTKDLNQCSDRQGGVIATYGVKYSNPMSDINTMPLTEGKQTCRQTTEKRIIQQVMCNERLEFVPTRLQEGAVKVITEATMELTYVKEESKKATASPCKYVTNLKFDHSYVPGNMESEMKEVENLLDKMCQGDVVPQSARQYSDLLDSLRSLNKEELAKVYQTAEKCKATAKIMQHVMPEIGTKAAAQFIIEKVETSKDPIKTLVREDWMGGLKGVHNPPVELLERAAAIVTEPSNSEFTIIGRGYLGVGSLINNYCLHNKECEKKSEVKKAIQRFVNNLEMCKSGSSDHETVRRALYSLRALGNAGPALAMEGMPEIINQCVNNKALIGEIRLSALSVMRRIPCGKENEQARETLRNVIRDSSDDTEFRSYALLSILRCPELRDLETIRSVITDKSKPVSDKFGAFIISAISRMEESPAGWYWSPEFRSTLGALMSTREAALLAMKVDPMKTGAAMHRQQFWPKMNAGYMYDTNLIHSDKSTFPRTFHANVTVGLFGLAVNPFEFGIRQEGLESLIENMPSTDVFETPKDGFLPRLNPEKLQPILEKLKMSFYVRVFGNEVRYGRIDKDVITRLRERMDHRFNLDSLKSPEGHQGAEMFIDRALSLPTISGLPIRLAIRGSYRSQVRPSIKPEMKRDSEGRLTSINLKGDVKAGLSIELRTLMAAFIGGRKFGIQAVTRISSNAEYKPELQWEGTSLKIKVDMPAKILRAGSISNEIYVRRDKAEEPIVVDPEVRKTEWCSPGQGMYTGIKFCVHSEVPSRWNGLMTPGKFSYEIEKVDEQMKGVELVFKADHTRGTDGKIETIDFITYVDAPQSSKDRKILVQLKVSRPQRQMTAALETPWKKANLEVKMSGDEEKSDLTATFGVGEGQSPKRVYNLVVKRSSSSVNEGGQKHPKRTVTVEITRNDLSTAIFRGSGSMVNTGDLKEVSLKVTEMSIPNYYTLPSETSLTGEFGKHQTRGQGFSLKGKTPVRDFETEFGIKMEPEGKKMTYSHRFHYHSKPSGSSDDKYDRVVVWDVEFKREPTKALLVKSILRTEQMPILRYADHRISMLIERPSEYDLVTDMELEIMQTRFRIAQELHRQELSTLRGFKYDLTVSGFNMIQRTISIKYERQWEPKHVLELSAELRRGEIAVYHISLSGRRDAPGFGELKFRTFCPYNDFLLQAKGEKQEDGLMIHSLRFGPNSDLRFNFESRARITEQLRDIEAKIEIMGMVPVTLISRGSGSLFDGNWKHDGVLAYGPRKLVFGSFVNYQESPKGDTEGDLDFSFYFGSPEAMFKQYVNWHRVDRLVKIRGMTELGDEMYKLSGELDLAARRHRVHVEGPHSSSEVLFGRLENQRGYDLVVTHRCPAIEFQIFAKAGLSLLRSDIAGHFVYRLPTDEVKKVIGFKNGYSFDFTDGIDVGYVSAIQVNNKQWFVTANTTATSDKIALAFGLGNGDNFRHIFQIMGQRKWDNENVLRLKSLLEFHCTSLELPRLKFESDEKFVWNKDTGRMGEHEAHIRITRGARELWYRLNYEGMDPRKGMSFGIIGDSEYTKTTVLRFSYTSSLPTVTVFAFGRYGEHSGRLLGRVDVNKVEKGIDVSYTVSCYHNDNEHADISVRGQHLSDHQTFGRGFVTVEVRNMVYSFNGRWKNDEKKLFEIVFNTPHEGYTENIFRIWGRGKEYEQKTNFHRQMLVKIGSKTIHTTAWRQVEPTLVRGESKIDINGRIYALGYVIDHPEDNGYGEWRIRIRTDTPFEGYKTSTFLLWVSPCTKGMKGLSAVWGMTDAYPEITEQRNQMQIAYQIGDISKGGVMMSTRGKRNYETKKIYREASLIVKFPHVDFTVNTEATILPEKAFGWSEYRSQRYGTWRSEWSGTGNVEKAGSAQVELRGKLPEREEPISVKLSFSHQSDKNTFKRDITGQLTTNLPGYEVIRLRYDRGLDDEENIASNLELMLPSGKKVESKITFGFTPEETELNFKLNTPFEIVKEIGGELKYTKESNKHSVDIKFHRNERNYVCVATITKESNGFSGIVKLETPFERVKTASLSFKRSGNLMSPSGSESQVDLTINNQPKLHMENSGRLVGEDRFVSFVTKYDQETYKFVVGKEPGKFEIRLPTPWSCTIHYTGEISVKDDVFFGIQRHHTCSPYSFAGNVTLSMADAKRLTVNLETPIPYFKTFTVDVTYNYDEGIAQIEQIWPPIGLDIVVKREDKTAEFHSLVEPEQLKATVSLQVRGISIKYDHMIGQPTAGHIDFTITGAPVNVNFNVKREGPWSKPTSFECSLSAAGLDLYSLNGKWDFRQYPQTFTMTVDGVIYSKQVKLVYSGETQDPKSWKRSYEIKVAQKTHKGTVKLEQKKLEITYQNNDGKQFSWSGEYNYNNDGVKKSFETKYELTQSGFSTQYSKATWTSKHSIPASVEWKNIRENAPEMFNKLIESIEWNQKLVVDGTEKFYSIGKLNFVVPTDSTLIPMKLNFELTRLEKGEKHHVIIGVNKVDTTPTKLRLLVEIDDQKKVDMTGTIERRESWKYASVKLDFESPKQMSIHVERDATNPMNRVWTSYINMDKTVDKVGNKWQLTVKPADGTTSRGADIVLTCYRGTDDMILIEAGYARSLVKTFQINYNFFFKGGNMDKKWGFKQEWAYESGVFTRKADFTLLTREAHFTSKIGYEAPKHFFYEETYDFGSPSTKLDVKFDFNVDKISGFCQFGDKKVDIDGHLTVTDRHNYELDFKLVDGQSHTTQFTLRKTWSEATKNRTYAASLKSSKGEIDWFSYRYLGENVKSRGITLRLRKSEWTQDVVLRGNLEIDTTVPQVKIDLDTPFHNFGYLLRLERREDGVKEIMGRLRRHDGKITVMKLELDPENWSMEFSSNRTDGTRLIVHGHVPRTTYSFFEVERVAVDGTSEMLVRYICNLDPSEVHFNIKYNPRLDEIIRAYMTRRTEQYQEIVNKYKENVPTGLAWMREIAQIDELIVPFVMGPHTEHLKLKEIERQKWIEITKVWYENPDVKSMLAPIRLPSYENSIMKRILSEDTSMMSHFANQDMDFGRAMVAISQAVRQFLKDEWTDLSEMMGKTVTPNHQPIRDTLYDVRQTVIEYFSEVIQRIRERTTTSCLVHYVKMYHERLSEKYGYSDSMREKHERLMGFLSRIGNYLNELKEKYMKADPKKTAKDYLSQAKITQTTGEIDIKMPLPYDNMRSLRTPAGAIRSVEHFRETVERAIAAVKARLVLPTAQVTLQRLLGTLQYFRINQLKHYFQ